MLKPLPVPGREMRESGPGLRAGGPSGTVDINPAHTKAPGFVAACCRLSLYIYILNICI